MFKFWKSPRSSPNPSGSPSTSTSPRAQPSVNNGSTSTLQDAKHALGDTDGVIGLGLSVPTVESRSGQRGSVPQQQALLPGSNEGNGTGGQDKMKSGRRSSASQVAFVDQVGKERGRVEGNRSEVPVVLGTRKGTMQGDGSNNHNHDNLLSPAMFEDNVRATSPMSFSPSVASSFRNPYTSTTALTERDPNQIYGMS